MKEEKEAERKVREEIPRTASMPLCSRLADKKICQALVQKIKDRRAAKEEKERYEKMAEKMHKKRVERLKRREKRNKLLNS